MDTIARIKKDITSTVDDNYIGKYENSYDSKCILITAIKDYFTGLEAEGVLEAGSVVEIDIPAQKAYLKSEGVDVAGMTDEQIARASTGSKVFLRASIRIFEAIEDVDLSIEI